MNEKASPLMDLLFKLKVIGSYKLMWHTSIGPVMGMCEFVPYEVVGNVTVEYHGRQR